jgi:hypothetical protein
VSAQHRHTFSAMSDGEVGPVVDDAPACREAMAATVTVIRELCDAVDAMSTRQPAVPSKDMNELSARGAVVQRQLDVE